MKLSKALLPVVVILTASPLTAQERGANRLFISLFGGIVESSDFWSVPRQPVPFLTATNQQVGIDTFRLRRAASPGPTVGMGITYFGSSNLGFMAEFSWSGLGIRDECTIVAESAAGAASTTNDAYCDRLGSEKGSAGAINVMAGAVYRFYPRSYASPYVRLMAGVADQGGTTVEMSAPYGSQQIDRPVIRDPGSADLRPTFLGALGVMLPTSPAYQFRLEVRDQIYWRDVVDAPANNLGFAETSWSLKHNFMITLSLDIILERSRGRRY